MNHFLILTCCKGIEALQEQKKVGRVIYVINTIFFFIPEISPQPTFLFFWHIFHTVLCIGIATIIAQAW